MGIHEVSSWPKYTAAVTMGALLHDIGKAFLPNGLLDKSRTLSEGETRTLQCHTLLGEAVLKDVLVRDERILSAVRSHHEKWEGKGYPDGAKGEDIPIPARIVAIANLFDNLINVVQEGDTKRSDEAISNIIGKAQSHFDTFIVRTLLSGLGLYPAGTAIELSDGSLGVVLESTERNLLCPRVLLMRDASRKPVSGIRIIDIAGQESVFIRRAVDDFGRRDVSPLRPSTRHGIEPHVFRKYRAPAPLADAEEKNA